MNREWPSCCKFGGISTRRFPLNYKTIKRSFDRGLWSRAMVRTAVKKGVITAEESQEITDEKYQ